jgi:ion channel-forming bestrophin family protein
MLLKKRIPIYYILNKVKFELLYVGILSVALYFITERFKKVLPDIPLAIPAFLGTAISILLSFKLNQSYDRWWEARKVWGSIVNDSRSLVIQLKTLVNKGNDAAIKKIALRQIAWCYSLGQSLRSLDPVENLDGLLSPEDISEIKTHQNKPLAILQLHGADIRQLRDENQLELFAQVQMDSTLVRLCDAQGKCERIKSTVFPVTYRVFLHFIIYMFVMMLGISVTELEGHFEILLLLLISTAFFLLERTATHMQDPFENRPTDTAMTTIATTIEINIRQLIKAGDVPKPMPQNTFYNL